MTGRMKIKRFIVLCCLFLTSCAGSPPAYYRLSVPEYLAKPSYNGRPTLQVLPVQLMPHLASSKMVFQQTPQQFNYVESHVWMPSLKDQITEFLVLSLQAEVTNYWIVGLSQGVRLSKNKLLVSFSRFDFDKQSRVHLQGHWQWIKSGEIIHDEPFTLSEQISETGYDALVSAFSRQLLRLSTDIAMRVMR
ncbi:MAG: ABC-type transport auxiliary lipoprotein family protein [Cellvibrionales bacterium]|nr:ABC-type transport auxiliary lipoprotein family protein [Cellvibrionales bacterium]